MDIHWRNTQKPVRFFFLDARCFAVLLLFLVHARTWTLVSTIMVMMLFWYFERKGLTFDASTRAFRSWILGRTRPSNSRRARRRLTDYRSF